MFAKTPDPRLLAYVVWLPMVFSQEWNVPGATSTMPDPRARHYWEGKANLRTAFQKPLGVDPDVEVWDVYLVYGPAAKWTGAAPPAPDFWAQQGLRSDAPVLRPAEFARVVRERFLSGSPTTLPR